MKKTFCDRCGAECDGVSIQRFTIFDVNRSIDVCDSCYSDFFRWLKSGENRCTVKMKDGINDLDDAYRFIKNDMEKKDDSYGLDEFIKDVIEEKNNEN